MDIVGGDAVEEGVEGVARLEGEVVGCLAASLARIGVLGVFNEGGHVFPARFDGDDYLVDVAVEAVAGEVAKAA